MKKALFIVSLVAIVSVCKPQDTTEYPIRTYYSDKPPGFVVFGVAPAFPLGSYNSDDPNKDDGEFAAPGFLIKADAGYEFGVRRRIGINATVAVARSYGDEDEFARAINNYEGETKYPGFLNTFIIPGTMFTGWGRSPVAVDFNFQPFGLAISTHKGLMASTADTTVSIDKSTDLGWAYKFGITIRVMKMKHLVISGFVDYIGAIVTRDNVATRINGAIVHISDYASNPQMLTVGIGLGFSY